MVWQGSLFDGFDAGGERLSFAGMRQRIDSRWVPFERVQRRGLAAARRERDALRARWGGPRR